jgi:hypothetical protein
VSLPVRSVIANAAKRNVAISRHGNLLFLSKLANVFFNPSFAVTGIFSIPKAVLSF